MHTKQLTDALGRLFDEEGERIVFGDLLAEAEAITGKKPEDGSP